MDHWTDEQLFSALKTGNKNALSILFLRHYTYLTHYGLQIVADRILVEEAIQELFVYLFESFDRFGEVRQVKAYLFRSLRRRILEHWQRQKRQEGLKRQSAQWTDIQFAEEDILWRETEQDQIRTALLEALNDLPWRQREAVYLRYYNGLNTKEIAEIMGTANQTVLNTLYQALKNIRKHKKLKKIIGFSFTGLLICLT